MADDIWNAAQAVERYRNDRRFRAYVQSIVARVMQDHGPVDPERADYDARDIATRVGAMLLETMFREDGELARPRMELDAYKKFAEESLSFRPFPLTIAAPDTTSADTQVGMEPSPSTAECAKT